MLVLFATRLTVILKTPLTGVVEVNVPAGPMTLALMPLRKVTVITCVVPDVGDVTGETSKRSCVGRIQPVVGVLVTVLVLAGVLVIVLVRVNVAAAVIATCEGVFVSVRVDADYDIGPTNYNFVDVRDFGSPRLRGVIVRPQENLTIIRNTTNITNISYVNNVVYNQGPQYDTISRESRQPIRQLKLERREELDAEPGSVRNDQLRSRVQGDSLRVVALPIDAKAATAPKKVVAKVEKAEVDRGWKNAGSAADDETR